MEDALNAKNKVEFVDGTIPKLENDSYDLKNRMYCDAMVMSWLKNFLKAFDMQRALGTSSSTLKNTTQKVMHQGFIKLDGQSHYCSKRRLEWQHIYYTKLRGSWDELQTLNPIP